MQSFLPPEVSVVERPPRPARREQERIELQTIPPSETSGVYETPIEPSTSANVANEEIEPHAETYFPTFARSESTMRKKLSSKRDLNDEL